MTRSKLYLQIGCHGLAILPMTVGHSVVRDAYPDWGFFTRFVVCTGTTAVLIFLFWRVGYWLFHLQDAPPQKPSR